MKIIEKIGVKAKDNFHQEGVTIAFLGDSVTQGCFEVYTKRNGQIETIFDKKASYEMYLLEILNMLYPEATVNIINAGISGDNAPNGLERMDQHVLRHEPDLVVVCYGLNDCSHEEDSIARYTMALAGIFCKLKAAGCEIIFMTPNMMNTKISDHLDMDLEPLAERFARLQNDGTMDEHMEAAREVCASMEIPVCDCYALWKMLADGGVNTTDLLSNRLNHPTREMNKMFAYELVRTMFER